MTTRCFVAVVSAFGLVLLIRPVVAQQPARTGPSGTITISRADYDQLIDLAGRRPAPVGPPPVAGAVTHATISARVDQSTVTATMRLDGEVFVNGPTKVPLIDGATLLDARVGNQPMPLVVEGSRHLGIVPGPAAFTATLQWGAPVVTSAGRGSFSMPVPQAGSAVATFDVAGEQTDLQVSPGLVLRRTTANGRTLVEATLDPGSTAQVTWSTRETAPTTPPREVRLLSDVKTLVSLGDADVRLVSVVTVTVVQGDPLAFEVTLPPGYAVSSVTGASLQQSEERPDTLLLSLINPSQRQHQFIVTLERSIAGGSFRLDTRLPSVAATQRESGEVVVEGLGPVSVSTTDLPGLRRVDVQEVDRVLTSARPQALLAAFKYQRTATTGPTLVLDVTRFADAAVLAAVAEQAVATTLVTSEGRALTEVKLRIRNRAQPFVKVAMPAGASVLSVEVAGETAKPAEGRDGVRVPLLRPGFRPNGPYDVSFIYIHSGVPFAKKGTMEMALPPMDLPVTMVEWELFVPEQYRADRFGGNTIPAHFVPTAGPVAGRIQSLAAPASGRDSEGGLFAASKIPALSTGQIGGRVIDASGAPIPGATVTAAVGNATRTVQSGGNGAFVLSNVPSGSVTLSASLTGFATTQQTIAFNEQPTSAVLVLNVGQLDETITVAGTTPVEKDRVSRVGAEPSANVQSLQRRAAGVLPVRMEVPRAGTSHRFLKAGVVTEPTTVSFRYRRR